MVGIGVVWGALATMAQAQVNVAPLVEYAKKPGPGFDLQGRFGFALGNVDLLDLGLDVAFHTSRPFPADRSPDPERAWFRDRFVIFGNYAFKTFGQGDDRSVAVDSKLAHARYTFMVVPRFGFEVFGQAGNDLLLLLDLRALGGGGPRFVLLESKRGRVWAGTGYMAEYEDRADGVEPERVLNHRWNTYVSAELVLLEGKLDLISTTYVQPRFDELEDLQFLEEAKLRIRVTERLGFGFEARLRLDTQPPGDLVPTDLRLTNTVEIHL